MGMLASSVNAKVRAKRAQGLHVEGFPKAPLQLPLFSGCVANQDYRTCFVQYSEQLLDILNGGPDRAPC